MLKQSRYIWLVEQFVKTYSLYLVFWDVFYFLCTCMPKYVPANIVQSRRNVWGLKDYSPPYFCNYSNQKKGADIAYLIYLFPPNFLTVRWPCICIFVWISCFIALRRSTKNHFTKDRNEFFWHSGGPVRTYMHFCKAI